MAYLSAAEYDQGGRIQSLDGLAAVTYDDGATRNLLGANLGAVKYDDGGRFRTLLGMGQDVVDMAPPDVGIPDFIRAAQPRAVFYAVRSISHRGHAIRADHRHVAGHHAGRDAAADKFAHVDF
jgi:hypothetical protein